LNINLKNDERFGTSIFLSKDGKRLIIGTTGLFEVGGAYIINTSNTPPYILGKIMIQNTKIFYDCLIYEEDNGC